MPQLSDLVGKKKFVKKSFRPWDLSGSGTTDGSMESEQPLPLSKTEDSAREPLVLEEKVLLKEDLNLSTHHVPKQTITGNKTGNISDNKQVTTRQQSDNIGITLSKQPDNIEVTTRQHSDNDRDNVTDNTKDISYLTDAIKKLTGLQKNIFLYIINVCSARGGLDTGPILSLDLANAANCTAGSAKTSLNRLVEKQVVMRHQGKACRGGHMVLGISKEIQAAAIQAQQALFNPLKSSYSDNVTGNITSNDAYSSSSIYNKTTTTALPDEWKKIDISSLSDIGFTETQLRQLYQSNMTVPDIIQESICHFAYGLEHNPKLKTYSDPLNVLMGVLRKGGNWIEKNYISPKEQALVHLLEQKKREAERLQELEKKIVEQEFKIWLAKLDQREKENILKGAPPKDRMLSKEVSNRVDEGYLLQYFKTYNAKR
jgi:hypothetical protein